MIEAVNVLEERMKKVLRLAGVPDDQLKALAPLLRICAMIAIGHVTTALAANEEKILRDLIERKSQETTITLKCGDSTFEAMLGDDGVLTLASPGFSLRVENTKYGAVRIRAEEYDDDPPF